MVLHRQAGSFPDRAEHQPSWATGAGAVARWTQDLLASMRTPRTARAAAGIILSGFVVCAELRQPAQAQYRNGLGWMGTFDQPRGSRTEFAAPSGYTCRYEQGSRPSLNVGAGVTEPPILSGIGGTTVIAPRLEKPSPVAGVFLHIPLGVDRGTNCKRLAQLEMAMLKLQNAKTLMMDGLITKEQLELVVRQTYAIISSVD
jgi:hypothetical protein